MLNIKTTITQSGYKLRVTAIQIESKIKNGQSNKIPECNETLL